MMKRLLWWCICLFVSSSLSVVRGQSPSPPPLYPMVKTDAPQNNNEQLATDNGLPCQDSSPVCLQTLGKLAVQNSRELAVLGQAIGFQRKKLWTNWLNADGLNPVAIGLRIARNAVGGGDRAAAKRELAKLATRQAELETAVRQTVVQAVLEYESNAQRLAHTQATLTTHLLQLRLIEINYRLGAGTTEEMLGQWQRREALQEQLNLAALQMKRALRLLHNLVLAPHP